MKSNIPSNAFAHLEKKEEKKQKNGGTATVCTAEAPTVEHVRPSSCSAVFGARRATPTVHLFTQFSELVSFSQSRLVAHTFTNKPSMLPT